MYIYIYIHTYLHIFTCVNVEDAAPLESVAHGQERERGDEGGASVDGGGQAHRLALDFGREDLRDNQPGDRPVRREIGHTHKHTTRTTPQTTT